MTVQFPIEDVGAHGMVKDLPARVLPPGAWTDLNNVRLIDGYVQKSPGRESILTPSVIPYAFLPAPIIGDNIWLYAGVAQIYGFSGPTQAEITRVSGNYTGTEFDLWIGGVFNGLPFLTNGVDAPQVWNPISLSQRLVDLPNWPAGYTCKIMRAYKNYLVALDVAYGGTRYRRMVKWSNPAEPGAVPDSWDPTVPANDAGENSLSEGVDSLIDCLPLGGTNILYLEGSTWAMRYSGGTFIFDFDKIFDTSGLLAPDCAKPFKNSHFAVTQDDVVIHDGTNMQSVISAKNRRWLFANLNSSAYFITKVVPLYHNQEFWICFPKDSGVLDTALIWNWGTNTWYVRDLPNVRAVASSRYSPTYSFDLWDTGDTLTWDEETLQSWGGFGRTRFTEALLLSPENTEGIQKDTEELKTDLGVNFRSYVERTGLCYVGGRDGKLVPNPTSLKNSVTIWPRIDAVDGTIFSIYVGSQQVEGGDVNWDGPHSFVVGVDTNIASYISGRFYAIRIEETQGNDWKLTGYDVEVNEVSLH